MLAQQTKSGELTPEHLENLIKLYSGHKKTRMQHPQIERDSKIYRALKSGV